MKRLIAILFLISFSFNLAAGGEDFVCGMTGSTFYRGPQQGGLYKTSYGTLNALVIFVQFSDDTLDSAGWPITSPPTLPSWASSYMNGLHNYFYEMSSGVFNLTGTVYSSLYVPDTTQSEYANIGEVNHEALTALDDQINYALFDNWTGTDEGADGDVDLIFMVYRNFEDRLTTSPWGSDWTGLAALLLSNDILTDDGVWIRGGFSDGSGVQQRGGLHGYSYSLYVSAHEYGHHLFGSGHIFGVSNLALMTGGPVWNDDRGMISWEREKMNWITYTDKSTDGTVTLTDYMTTDVVYRIPVSSTEYFLVENRLKSSSHDYAGDDGIYVLHVTNALNNLPNIDVECADGNWDFTRDTQNQTLTRSTPNPNGDSEMSYVSTYGGVTYACYTPIYYEDAAWGDSEDAFDLSFNNVFSPVSNPRSTNGGSVEFSLEVTGSNQITLYFDGDGSGDEYEGTPSKPQNLQISWQNNHPRLDWDANTEPDLDVYNIYKKRGTGSYSFLNSTTNTYYVDNTEVQYGGPPDTKIYAYYKITAEDTQDKESIASNEVRGAVNQQVEKSAAENNEAIQKLKYGLAEIYPNPFNPTTTISYSLPANGSVVIKIYDMLGREAAELINGIEEAGSHSIVFDASNLASGAYIVNMIVNSADGEVFKQSRKILLMK